MAEYIVTDLAVEPGIGSSGQKTGNYQNMLPIIGLRDLLDQLIGTAIHTACRLRIFSQDFPHLNIFGDNALKMIQKILCGITLEHTAIDDHAGMLRKDVGLLASGRHSRCV